jgi:hypothetical protein
VTVTAAFPGTFNPPTIAHLAVAVAARSQYGIDRVDFILSTDPLGKDGRSAPPVHDRAAILRRVADRYPWLDARVTSSRLLADVAAGYDYLIVGADKWAQVIDPVWYGGSETDRDKALGRLPTVLVAPRPPFPLPTGVAVVEMEGDHAPVSSTAVRGGRHDWMLPEARLYAERTGAWHTP